MARRMVVAVFSWPKKVTSAAGVLAQPLDEVAGLHEHAARAAGRIEHHAVVGLDHVHDGLHERGRREELAVVLRALHRELHQEVLIDPAEHVARGRADLLAVEDAQKVFKDIMIEALVVVGKLALERLEVLLDGVHGLDQGRAEVGVLWAASATRRSEPSRAASGRGV